MTFKPLKLDSQQVTDFVRFSIHPGLNLYVHRTDKFKGINIHIFLQKELSSDATSVSLVQSVLRRGCSRYINMRKISMFLESLYGAGFESNILKVGERQIMTFGIRILNEKFAPRRINSLDKALDFLRRILTQPAAENGALKKEYVDTEKENLKKFLLSLINDRLSYSMQKCIQNMCAGEKFSIFRYGRLEDIAPLTPASLYAAHKSLINELPIDIMVIGDVNPEKFSRKISDHFSFFSRRRKIVEPAQTLVDVKVTKEREFIEKMQIEQAKLVMGFRTYTTLKDDDFTALSVLNGIFGAFPHSRLFVNVREKHGLCYYASSMLEKTKGLMFVNSGIDAKNYQKVTNLIKKELDDIRQGSITDDELNKTKKMLINAIESRDDTPVVKIHSFLEMLINERISDNKEIIESIKACKKDKITQVAQRVKLDTIYLLSHEGGDEK